ncbi:MAG: PilW family protein [Methylococcales bacterium]
MNKQQRGLTLIELMISMVLSLGLIAGISSLFLQMQKSNKVQRGLSAMADDSSYVQEVLQKEMRSIGRLRSRSDTNGTNEQVFLNPPGDVLGSSLDLLQGEYIKGNDTSPENDSFVMRYQLLDANDLRRTGNPSNGSSPCTQDVLMDDTDPIDPAAPAGAKAGDPASVVHIVNVYFYLNGNTLSCLAQRHLVTVGSPGTSQCIKNCNVPGSDTDFTHSSTPIPIIGNVVRLLLDYGVDTDADNAANYYVKAPDVDVGANHWSDVVSVRMTVVVRSEDKFIRDSAVAYKLDGVDETPADDQHQLYKVFTTTIALRNQLM